MLCNKDHSSIQKIMQELPDDQGGFGRHKCAACAYEQGYQDGRKRIMTIDIAQVVGSLSESQAQNQRHKSPHVAYMRGYYDGILKSFS